MKFMHVLPGKGIFNCMPGRGDAIRRVAAAGVLSGLTGLQIHAGPPMKVCFKDIRLKELQ